MFSRRQKIKKKKHFKHESTGPTVSYDRVVRYMQARKNLTRGDTLGGP